MRLNGFLKMEGEALWEISCIGKRVRAGLGASNHESKRAPLDMALQVEKKRPLAAGGHTLQQKDRDPFEVEPSFGGRNSEGAGHGPRLVYGRVLNAFEGTLKS